MRCLCHSFQLLVAGPIERSKNLLIQINEKHRFEFARVRDGLLLMLYGYFQKVVLAEYLAIAVDNVYNTCAERTGYQLLIATVLFAFQIYCDFGSYSNIATAQRRSWALRSWKISIPRIFPCRGGVLEKMAHFALYVVSGLSVHSARRQSEGKSTEMVQPDGCLFSEWPVARGELAICSGRIKRSLSGVW